MTHNLTNELFNFGNLSGHLPDPMTKVNPWLKIFNFFFFFEWQPYLLLFKLHISCVEGYFLAEMH